MASKSGVTRRANRTWLLTTTVLLAISSFARASSEIVIDGTEREIPLPSVGGGSGGEIESEEEPSMKPEEDAEAVLEAVQQEIFWRSKHNNSAHHATSSSSTDVVQENAAPSVSFVPHPPSAAASKKALTDHFPPEGFVVTTRVVSDPSDGLSYWSDVGRFTIPYRECSSTGLTTPDVPLRSFSVRHLPPAGSDPAWTTAGPRPRLVVCLAPTRITVSGGRGDDASRVFRTGEVVLLEDVDGRGHKMVAANDDDDDESGGGGSVLTLDLDPARVDVAGGAKTTTTTGGAAPTDDADDARAAGTDANDADDDDGGGERDRLARRIARRVPLRRAFLTAAGALSSSALTFFLGKVAPHVLAVVAGGGCVVVGGTCLVVSNGEKLMDLLADGRKKRRMDWVLSQLEEEEAAEAAAVEEVEEAIEEAEKEEKEEGEE